MAEVVVSSWTSSWSARVVYPMVRSDKVCFPLCQVVILQVGLPFQGVSDDGIFASFTFV